MGIFRDFGDGIQLKKSRLNLDLYYLKCFFICIFGFSTLKNLDCAEISYETCDSNKLLADFDRKNPPKKLPKNLFKNNFLFNGIYSFLTMQNFTYLNVF